MGAHRIPKIDYACSGRPDGYRAGGARYSSEASLTSSACRLHSILLSRDATCLRTVSPDDWRSVAISSTLWPAARPASTAASAWVMPNTDSSLSTSGMANALLRRSRASSRRPPIRLNESGATLMSIQ